MHGGDKILLKAEIQQYRMNIFSRSLLTKERREIGRKSEGDVEGGDDFGIGTI